MTAPAVVINGVTQTAYVQNKSLAIKFKSADFTLVDPATLPVVGQLVSLLGGSWTGTLVGVEETSFHGKGLWIKCTANNHAVLTDLGSGINLSDTPNGTTTFGYKDLTVTRTRKDGVTETRAQLTTYTDGLWPGNTFDLTAVAHGFSAETFTVMDMTLGFGPKDQTSTPEYVLDLGLGDFDTSTTGASDGGSLAPVDMNRVITEIASTACCGGGDGGCGEETAFDTFADRDGTFDEWLSPSSRGDLEWHQWYAVVAGTGGAVDAYVDGGRGHLGAYQGSSPGAGEATGIGMEIANVTDCPWNTDAWVMTLKFMGIGRGMFYTSVRKHDGTASRAVVISFDPTFIRPDDLGTGEAIGLTNVTPSVALPTIQAIDQNLKWEYRRGEYTRAKIWPDGDAEPAEWDITEPGGTLFLEGPLDFRFLLNHSGNVASSNSGVDFWDLNFAAC